MSEELALAEPEFGERTAAACLTQCWSQKRSTAVSRLEFWGVLQNHGHIDGHSRTAVRWYCRTANLERSNSGSIVNDGHDTLVQTKVYTI